MNLNHIPDELLVDISKFMNFDEIFVLRCVSVKFRKIFGSVCFDVLKKQQSIEYYYGFETLSGRKNITCKFNFLFNENYNCRLYIVDILNAYNHIHIKSKDINYCANKLWFLFNIQFFKNDHPPQGFEKNIFKILWSKLWYMSETVYWDIIEGEECSVKHNFDNLSILKMSFRETLKYEIDNNVDPNLILFYLKLFSVMDEFVDNPKACEEY